MLQINVQALQPLKDKTSRTVEIYINERYVSSLEVDAAECPAALSVDIEEELWVSSGEQKLALKYPDRSGAAFGAMSLDYTLGIQEIYLERK